MIYICPICEKEFENSAQVAKHSLACWRAKNPNHKSKAAPRSDDIVTRTINEEVLNFFERGTLCKKSQ